MNKLVVGVVGAIVMLSAASPVRADWQFTEWGMTKEEFKEASPVFFEDSIERCRAFRFDSSTYITSEWKAGKFDFHNCYDFNQNGDLNRIHMELGNLLLGGTLLDAMQSKYGEPSDATLSKDINLKIYEWRTSKSLITYFSIFSDTTRRVYIEHKDINPVLEKEAQAESKL